MDIDEANVIFDCVKKLLIHGEKECSTKGLKNDEITRFKELVLNFAKSCQKFAGENGNAFQKLFSDTESESSEDFLDKMKKYNNVKTYSNKKHALENELQSISMTESPIVFEGENIPSIHPYVGLDKREKSMKIVEGWLTTAQNTFSPIDTLNSETLVNNSSKFTDILPITLKDSENERCTETKSNDKKEKSTKLCGKENKTLHSISKTKMNLRKTHNQKNTSLSTKDNKKNLSADNINLVQSIEEIEDSEPHKIVHNKLVTKTNLNKINDKVDLAGQEIIEGINTNADGKSSPVLKCFNLSMSNEKLTALNDIVKEVESQINNKKCEGLIVNSNNIVPFIYKSKLSPQLSRRVQYIYKGSCLSKMHTKNKDSKYIKLNINKTHSSQEKNKAVNFEDKMDKSIQVRQLSPNIFTSDEFVAQPHRDSRKRQRDDDEIIIEDDDPKNRQKNLTSNEDEIIEDDPKNNSKNKQNNFTSNEIEIIFDSETQINSNFECTSKNNTTVNKMNTKQSHSAEDKFMMMKKSVDLYMGKIDDNENIDLDEIENTPQRLIKSTSKIFKTNSSNLSKRRTSNDVDLVNVKTPDENSVKKPNEEKKINSSQETIKKKTPSTPKTMCTRSMSNTPSSLHRFNDNVKYMSTPVQKKARRSLNYKIDSKIPEENEQTLTQSHFNQIIETGIENNPTKSKTDESMKITKNKSIQNVDNKEKAICVTCSCLSAKEKDALKGLVKSQKWKYSDAFNDNITHLVIQVDNQNQAPRSLKYVQAISAGCWIVSFSWVSLCIDRKEHVLEEPFEVLDTSGKNGPHISRISERNLFKNMTFFCLPPFTDLDKNILDDIIIRAGGNVAKTKDEIIIEDPNKISVIIAEPKDTVDYRFDLLCSNNKIITVNVEWILESLGKWKAENMEEWLLSHVNIPDVNWSPYFMNESINSSI